MPYLGAHMSIAGGLHHAFAHIRKVKGKALQIFTKNQRQWHAAPISADDVARFKEARHAWGNYPVAAHNTYLINLASHDPAVREKSVAAMADEIQRCVMLGIPYLIMHPGSYVEGGRDEGIDRFVAGLDQSILAGGEKAEVMILLETTAGQGTGLGSSFEELGRIINSSRYDKMLGVCLDTCHIFAAGYDIRTPAIYRQTMNFFDQHIGLDRLLFFHLNDSKKELGSHVDRHEHIDQGHIGVSGFSNLLNDPRFAEHPMVLETPKGKDLQEDMDNLTLLTSVLKKSGRK